MDNVTFAGNYVIITGKAFLLPTLVQKIKRTIQEIVLCSYCFDKDRLKKLKDKNI